MQAVYFLKERLAGGLLCCLVLLAAYLFQMLFPEMYVDAFSSSIYLSMWLTLFVGALLWTFRERNAQILPSEITDWQCIAAFLLLTSNQIFMILPKEYQEEVAPVLSAYTLPALVVGGIVMAGLIKLLITLYRHLNNERQRSVLQTQRVRKLLDSTPSVHGDILLVRRLRENKSISQLSVDDYFLLVEGCRMIDPNFFIWLRERDFQLSSRDIVWCVLVRMQKTREEITSILGIVDGTYRTMLSRLRKRLNVGEIDLEAFLKKL